MDRAATYSGEWQEPAKVEEVRASEEYFDIRLEGSTGFGLDRKYGVEPKVGDTIELNTVGFSEIRGMKLNGQVVYLKSDEEADAEHEAWKAKRKAEEQAKFEQHREEFDKAFEALPEPIRARIARLRTKNDDFRWEMEPYELFLSGEAVKIADALKTEDAVIEFAKADTERQKQLVPNLEWQEHSGNTFGFACKIAHMYLVKPAAVKFMHGAFAPIAGCDGVGCHPLTPEEEKEVEAIL